MDKTILQKLKDRLSINKKNNEMISITKLQGLTIIGTKKELNQLPLEVQALTHNIFERKSDGSLEVMKMRILL